MVNFFKNIDKGFLKRLLLSIVGLVLIAFGSAMTMKADLGQGSVAALSKNIEYITAIKAGTLMAGVNYICFVAQVIMLGKEFKITYLLQLITTTIFGVLVNFFYYDLSLISNLPLDSYISKLLLFVVSCVICAIGVSITMKMNLLQMPYDGFSNVLTNKIKKPFHKVRLGIDLTVLTAGVLIMVMYDIPNTSIREGTVLMTLFFGKIIGLFNKWLFKE